MTNSTQPHASLLQTQAQLVDNIIAAYHTTRMSGVPASEHVLRDYGVQHTFKQLATTVVSMQQNPQQASAAENEKAKHNAQAAAEQESARAAAELQGRAAIAQLAAIRVLMNSFSIPDVYKLTLVLDYLDLPATHIPRSQRK